MKLDQVHAVYAKAFQGSVEALPCAGSTAFTCFRREKEVLSVFGHPMAYALFGVPVARGGVDMIHPGFEEKFEHLVRSILAHGAEGRGPEKNTGAGMLGSSERSFCDHSVHPSSRIAWALRDQASGECRRASLTRGK